MVVYALVDTTQVLVTPDTLPFTISEPGGQLRDTRSWLAALRAAQSGDALAKGIDAKAERALHIPVLGRLPGPGRRAAAGQRQVADAQRFGAMSRDAAQSSRAASWDGARVRRHPGLMSGSFGAMPTAPFEPGSPPSASGYAGRTIIP